MRIVATLLLVLGLTACGGGPGQPEFPAGSTMARLQAAGKIVVGVKFDQPGVGFLDLATGKPEGFDIEMAKIVARTLGLSTKDIEWVQTVSLDREEYLKSGRVDVVIASYSITAARQAEVGQAGPYYETGQKLLVRKDTTDVRRPEDLEGRTVCSVEDSTSLENLRKYRAVARGLPTYTECVQQLLSGQVDAVSTDDAVLVGYARKQPDKLQVVGRSFHDERYGIGFRRGDTEFCRFLTATIRAAEADGRWRKAFENTLGKVGVDTPPAPEPDPC
jgi:glutamate transport system substrate-binding protein